MLSAHRYICVNGARVAETPTLVPSFSSKGFPDVDRIVEVLAPTITDSALVSAFDVFHGYVKGIPETPEFLILDSGGYESSSDTELSDTRMHNYANQDWRVEQLKKVMDGWAALQPTIAVSFDHSSRRIPLKQQIEEARDLFRGRKFGRELLVKPDSEGSRRVNIDAVVDNVYDLRDFEMIGFTEKELGYSIFNRMQNIKKVREALDRAGLNTPIHIFGSLDTISTPLYFLAGADVFDGLTWLRYSYSFGHAVYTRNAAALKYTLRTNDDNIDALIWYENYQAMQTLEVAMRRHIREGAFECFGEHGPMFEKAHKELFASKG